jgi:hypothetical protein
MKTNHQMQQEYCSAVFTSLSPLYFSKAGFCSVCDKNVISWAEGTETHVQVLHLHTVILNVSCK